MRPHMPAGIATVVVDGLSEEGTAADIKQASGLLAERAKAVRHRGKEHTPTGLTAVRTLSTVDEHFMASDSYDDAFDRRGTPAGLDPPYFGAPDLSRSPRSFDSANEAVRGQVLREQQSRPLGVGR